MLACAFLPTMIWSCTENLERAGDIDDGLRHLYIRLRRRGIATWMVVHDAAMFSYCIENKGIYRVSRAAWGTAIGSGFACSRVIITLLIRITAESF
jgi:hypothetical protein